MRRGSSVHKHVYNPGTRYTDISPWGGACVPQNVWWGTMPKRLGGEALFAPGRLGGKPYPKIFGEDARATFLRHSGGYLSLNIRVMRIGFDY